MQVISLLGGFTIAILDFILPPLLHLRIVCYGSSCSGSVAAVEVPSIGSSVPTSRREGNAEENVLVECGGSGNSNCYRDTTSGNSKMKYFSINQNPNNDKEDIEEDLQHNNSSNSRASMHTTGGKNRAIVSDMVFLFVGSIVCVVSTAMSIVGIFNKLRGGGAC